MSPPLGFRRALGAAALGAALLVSAAVFDSPSLYVPGAALVALAAGAAAWVRLAATGARVVRRPGPPQVVEEERWPLRVEVRPGVLPALAGELREPLLSSPVPLGGGTRRGIRIDVRFERRGRRRLEPLELVVRDPLGICEAAVSGGGEEEVLVLPRTEPVLAAAGGGAAAGRDGLGGGGHGPVARRIEAAAAELEIDGLRPYRDGAPASRIHWPTVARTGEMVERRLVADADSAPLVIVDASGPAAEESLDAAVRAAASLVLHLGRAGGCAVLLPGDRRAVEVSPDLGAWPAVHARLAVVEAVARAPLARGARAGAVFWVTGQAARRVPGPLARMVAGSRWLVAPATPAGHRPAFTVAGCNGVRLDRGAANRRRVA